VRELQAAGGTALNGSAAPGGPDRPAGASLDSLDGGHRPRRVRLLFLVAVLVFVTDLVSKTIVVATLSHRPPIRLLGGLLRLTELRNPGAAFSIGASSAVLTVVFSLIAVGVIIAILRTSRRLRSVPWAVTLGLLLGGAAGNLGDRIFRSPGPFRGYVVDWIQLPHWPVFNVADSCIVCGGILAVLLAARGVPLEGTRPVAGSPPDSDAPAGGQLGGTPVRDRSGQHPAGDGGR
jgi:signal peptidase II